MLAEILFGRKNKKGFNNIVNYNSKSMGGVLGVDTSVAKTTVSSVLTTAGFISGVHHIGKNQGWKKASKSVGKSIISVPAKPMNNLADQIINKTNEQLAKGKNVHVKEQSKEKEKKMEQVVLPKSNRKIYYQIFKGISFIDLFVFSSFLITYILIAYLLLNLILKWITTTIMFLLGCLSLVKNSNETRVYNTIFNAIKYTTKLLVNRKIIVKPHYVNTEHLE